MGTGSGTVSARQITKRANYAGMKKTLIPVRVDQEIWKVEKLRNKLFKIAAFGED